MKLPPLVLIWSLLSTLSSVQEAKETLATTQEDLTRLQSILKSERKEGDIVGFQYIPQAYVTGIFYFFPRSYNDLKYW